MDPAERSFEEFMAAAGPALLRTAWMLTGDASSAEDLLQTALAKTWPRWAGLAARGDPAAYVRKAMVNTQISWWRRRWRAEVPTASMPERASGADALGAVDDRSVLRAALAELPARQRAVVVLRYYEDLSEEQAAAVLGCAVGTVKSQAAKGLARLRTAIGSEPSRPSGAAPRVGAEWLSEGDR